MRLLPSVAYIAPYYPTGADATPFYMLPSEDSIVSELSLNQLVALSNGSYFIQSVPINPIITGAEREGDSSSIFFQMQVSKNTQGDEAHIGSPHRGGS